MSIEDIKKKLGELYLNAEECKKDNQAITNAGVDNWHKTTQEYINKGLDTKEAGRKAAQELFGKYFKDNTKDFIARSANNAIESKGARGRTEEDIIIYLLNQISQKP
jgi:hypothetical protein